MANDRRKRTQRNKATIALNAVAAIVAALEVALPTVVPQGTAAAVTAIAPPATVLLNLFWMK